MRVSPTPICGVIHYQYDSQRQNNQETLTANVGIVCEELNHKGVALTVHRKERAECCISPEVVLKSGASSLTICGFSMNTLPETG